MLCDVELSSGLVVQREVDYALTARGADGHEIECGRVPVLSDDEVIIWRMGNAVPLVIKTR